MKQLFSVVICFLVVGLVIALVSSPSQADVDAARKEGYNDGYDQALEDEDIDAALEAAYFSGFCEGITEGNEIRGDYSTGTADIDGVLEGADAYAFKNTGRDVYEAWNDIMIYVDNNGANNELARNAETVMYYCMYLSEYDFYYEPDFTDIFE